MRSSARGAARPGARRRGRWSWWTCFNPARQSKTRENLLAQLTEREREILEHLAQGMSNKAIARALDISYDTVKLHVRHILSNPNFSSRVEAAVFAVEQRTGPQGSSEP